MSVMTASIIMSQLYAGGRIRFSSAPWPMRELTLWSKKNKMAINRPGMRAMAMYWPSSSPMPCSDSEARWETADDS